jgi:membrane-associated protease RseP (regulator of RpoE activity)
LPSSPVHRLSRAMHEIVLIGIALLALGHGIACANAAQLRAGSGVLVEFVEPGTAAAEAGFRAGDIVTAIDGRPINRWADLDLIVAASGGRGLTIDLVRSGTHLRLRAAPRPARRGTRSPWVRELGLGSYGKPNRPWWTSDPGTDFIPIPVPDPIPQWSIPQ